MSEGQSWAVISNVIRIVFTIKELNAWCVTEDLCQNIDDSSTCCEK